MNHIDEIFLRADIQQVREFLLHGAECAADMRTYDERMESADRKVAARLRMACSDKRECEEITGLIYDYVSAVQDVYMELGLQAGVILAAQVCQNLKTAFGGG
ncbi:hypothetical protein CE91St44_13430 [Oscillospiraceae bacterium]|uniref:hypothetical protein n=1 Tax=Allofournierella sp. TaxID=1940256 RepID=UPI0015B2B328|nr:hypothetical protein CE91St44_13430 [Oscillospiraceae bacterium]